MQACSACLRKSSAAGDEEAPKRAVRVYLVLCLTKGMGRLKGEGSLVLVVYISDFLFHHDYCRTNKTKKPFTEDSPFSFTVDASFSFMRFMNHPLIQPPLHSYLRNVAKLIRRRRWRIGLLLRVKRPLSARGCKQSSSGEQQKALTWGS